MPNPVAIHTEAPCFSWQLSADGRNRAQTAYRVTVADDPGKLSAERELHWDSGKVISNNSFHVVYEGARLESDTRYYWRVVAWDETDREGEPSETASFHIGLLQEEDWSGQWIGAPDIAGSPLFRGTFPVGKPCERAVVYFACLGYGELYLDGSKVGDHVLDPNWSDYDDRTIEGLLYPYNDNGNKSVYYVAYDITADLTVGKHSFGTMLGNGFYNQTARTVEGRMSYGNPRFLLQLMIKYADGSEERIVSDGSWRNECGPILFDNVFVGEVYDARREIEGWCEPEFDESDWQPVHIMSAPSGVLRAQQCPADKVMGTIRPICRTQLGEGCYVYDMGQNFSGWVRLRVRSTPGGSRFTLRFAEELHPNGTLDFTSAGGTDQIQHDVYISRGDDTEDYEPRFVWHGFRYVEISGFPGDPGDDAAIGVIVHASVDSVGSFECSDETLNRIQRMYRWSQLSNLHGGVPSDCPHRERLGYTGDGHITAKAAIYNFGMASFYRKWVQDIGDAQNIQTGFVPHTAPFNGGGGGPGWGSAYVIVPWLLYWAYGDLSLFRDHYEGMKRWVDYLKGCTDDGCIVEREEPGSWCLGDWCIPGSIELPERIVNTYFHAYVTKLLGRIAHVLGRGDDQRRYEARYADICLAFNERFLDPELNRYSIGRQGADIFAYALGCVPPEREPAIRNRLLMQYSEALGGCVDTGIFGTGLLFDTLADWGETDTAIALAVRDAYPGYGYMIKNGATTLWERWDGLESRNHPMFGSISAWMFEHLAGLRMCDESVAFARMVVKPPVTSKLAYAKAEISTIRGTYAAGWERDGDLLVLEAAVPVNGSIVIELPDRLRKPVSIFESGQPLFEGVDYMMEDNRIVLGSGHYRASWLASQ
ncbi:alpha-L-rhamnosidase [Cohnella hashimotonis]|uniref:alpha-L-rhamnosidase n=1 Tax=Cohnella hashimotonis TaxID=2826895 RepID=A0ABT6TIL7_9BACL|nr:alpha-L-rhamnosidase [Cohnella hashimotonis]MDI4645804.1 family 78 glycoside hydrolase catalytic domain [Cohnella hashimotonis]